MSEIATPAAESAADSAQPDRRFVVSARDLSRVYGEGETAVHTLRNVNLDVERLADGVIVKEVPGADEHEVLTALEEITRT